MSVRARSNLAWAAIALCFGLPLAYHLPGALEALAILWF